MKDVCCIGHITHDKIVLPKKTVDMSGGTAFYLSVAFNHLPKKVSFSLITKVGKDKLPTLEEMKSTGIDVINYPSQHSTLFENTYEANQNKRTQRVLAQADPFAIEELKDVEAKEFHLGSLLPGDFPKEVIEYLAGKGAVSIDAQGFLREVRGTDVYPVDWKDKKEILQYVHTMELNMYEMEVVTGFKNPHEAAKQLHKWGVKEVVITFGDEGSLIYAEDKFFNIPAYKANSIVDTTGCGDTYSAGYLYCRSLGMGFEESGNFAAAMCTLKLEHNGPFVHAVEDVKRVFDRPRHFIEL